MKCPGSTLGGMLRHPAPERKNYFCGVDYAMACMRVHERRLKFDREVGLSKKQAECIDGKK